MTTMADEKKCRLCGQGETVKPFPLSTPPAPPNSDNAWSPSGQAHVGCLKAEAAQKAAQKGFGIDPAKDNTARPG